jgi:LPXTG-motif cell wall-anchored protein
MRVILLNEQAGIENMVLFFLGILFLMLIGAVYVNYKRRKNTKLLKSLYENALKGSSKKNALEIGRLYYGSMRNGGKATIYDEQALSNDIKTMTVK